MVTKPGSRTYLSAAEVSRKYGFRSGLEETVAADLTAKGVSFTYESEKIHYVIPESKHTYTPDFRITTSTGKVIYVETKGRFLREDRQKHLLIREQHPDLDIRFVFQNANAKIDKGSPTSYRMWADKHGFRWAHRGVPNEWINE